MKMKITKHRTGSYETWDPLISEPDTRDKWFNNLTLSEDRFLNFITWDKIRLASPASASKERSEFLDQTVNVALDAVIGFALLFYKPCNEGFTLRTPYRDIFAK